MLLQGMVGIQQLADGAQNTVRTGNTGEMMVSELNGKYYELSKRGKLWTASNQQARALSLLSGTCTGFCLTNPINSVVNLVLIDLCVALVTAPAGVAGLALALGAYSTTAVTQTSAETVRNANSNFAASVGVGLVSYAATLPTAPVVLRAVGGGPVATGSVTAPFIKDDIDGRIIIGPGCSVSLTAFTTAISTVSSMVWAELPI